MELDSATAMLLTILTLCFYYALMYVGISRLVRGRPNKSARRIELEVKDFFVVTVPNVVIPYILNLIHVSLPVYIVTMVICLALTYGYAVFMSKLRLAEETQKLQALFK